MAYHSFEVFKDIPKAGEGVSLLLSALFVWIFVTVQIATKAPRHKGQI